MKKPGLRQLLFWALCCDLGLVAKKLILPGANLVTDALHIPGGIGTAFSLMFLTLAAAVMPGRFCGALMGLTQSLIMLLLGHTGSMGLLAPIGYVVPGLTIDAVLAVTRRLGLPARDGCTAANCIASAAAALTANMIVFRLRSAALLLYLCVAALSGALTGLLAGQLHPRIEHAVRP